MGYCKQICTIQKNIVTLHIILDQCIMKTNLRQKYNSLLQRFIRLFSLTSVAFVVTACYGSPYAEYEVEGEVCNEEGKMLGLPLNRTLQGTGDIICGTFFICGAPADAEDFDSLTKEQIVKYYKMFEFPERFYLDKENGITSVQFNFDEEER